MININFLLDSDRKDKYQQIEKGVKEYKKIWKENGEGIVEVLEKLSGLEFQESFVNCIVYSSSILHARSVPLSLKANVSDENKKGTLVHELIHRLYSANNIRVKFSGNKEFTLELHKFLDLILYDALIQIFNKKVADNTVKWESKSETYKKAWDWTLSLSKEERAKKYSNLLAKYRVSST